MSRPDVPIADYALVADLRTGALIAPDGSVDWLCLPRFDSPAVFANLLGEEQNGRWRIRIADGRVRSRHYVGHTMALETQWEAPGGSAVTTDWMATGRDRADLVRQVHCTSGEVAVDQELVVRFDYGQIVPWVHRVRLGTDPAGSAFTSHDDGEEVLHAVAGPAALVLHGPLPGRADGDPAHRARHTLRAGESLTWVLEAHESWSDLLPMMDVDAARRDTDAVWNDFAGRITCAGPWAEQVTRSLLVLRSLSNVDTGGIVAAATTSLPEDPGGERNWDYRYCWLRDAALTLEALMAHGLVDDAAQWRNWLLRAVAGSADNLRIVYGLGGERHLPERTLDHLRGYADSRPVRVGNGAARQYQADVVGEVMTALAQLRDTGGAEDEFSWGLQRSLLGLLADRFDELGHGMWEMRGDLHHFTHGRVLMWSAFDQGIRAVEEHDLEGPADEWRSWRDRLRREIDERGVAADGSFRQTYDADEVDASLLRIPHTGYCAYDDERMLATVARIERELVDDEGFVHRYQTSGDGLAGQESSFLICTFWLVEQYAHSGRLDEARRLMDRAVGAANELGLMAEEYDAAHHRMAGNFPQAFSHLGLIRAADALGVAGGDTAPDAGRGRCGTAARNSRDA